MEYFAKIIVSKGRIILIAFLTIAIFSALLIPMVGINYDLSAYLPEETNTREAMALMKEEFSLTSHAQVMLENKSIPETLAIKGQLKSVSGVKSVLWLDDFVDIYQPLVTYPESLLNQYYIDNTPLLQVEFQYDEYSLETGEALEEIKTVVGEEGLLRGTAVRSKALRESTLEEVFSITIFVIPIFLLILVITTRSWFEPIIYLVVIGISVIINMGTNILFGEISFITLSSAAVLQLALSMDYSLFLMHRFSEEREKGVETDQAMINAITHSFSSLSASCLTTVAGFVALMFMRYRIGLDMSLVLGKGILISLVSVILLLPNITIISEKLLKATYHRSFLPSLRNFSLGILKIGKPLIILIALMVVPAYLAQGSNSFVYGESAVIDDEESKVGSDQRRIEEKFGVDNPVIVLFPPGLDKEMELIKELEKKHYISSVQSLTTLVDPYIPREFLPVQVLDNFISENYTRVVLSLDVPIESDETFAAVDDLKRTVSNYYDDSYLLGSSASVAEIREMVDRDFRLVDIVSVIAVAVIMMFTFKSISLPVLLVLTIKSAIWINMSIPYFTDQSLSFVGYMIVSAVQLGATIDYAILLTNRYLDNRVYMAKKGAAIKALENSGWSIITSALILFVAGMGVYIISSVGEVSEMGLLIGRGALLSCCMVLMVLPKLLVISDDIIFKTTIKIKALRERRSTMKKDIIVRVVSTVFIILLMTFSINAQIKPNVVATGNMNASEYNVIKDETIYGMLDSHGTVENLYVVNYFRVPMSGLYIDYGDYKYIENMTNSSTGTIKNYEIKWDLQANPEGFYYKGEMSNKELPWHFEISYGLNGKEVSAKELGSASGTVEIFIKVNPKEEFHNYFRDYFVTQIQVPINQNVVEIIEAEGANKVVTGKNATLSYTILPNTEMEYKIQLKSEKFSLDSINIIISPFNMDLGIDQDEIRQGISDLSGGIESMIHGTGRLQRGMHDLSHGVGELAKGTNMLDSNGKLLIKGMENYKMGMDEFQSATHELVKGSKEINGGLKTLAKEGEPLLEGYQQVWDVVDVVGNYIPCPEAMEFLKSVAAQSDSDNLVKAELARVAQFLYEQMTEVEELYNGFNMLNQGLVEYVDGVSQVAEQYSIFHEGLLEASLGVEELNTGFGHILEGNKEFIGGVTPINKGLGELHGEVSGVPKSVEELIKGQNQVKAGIDEAGELIDEILGDKMESDPVSFAHPEKGNPSTVQFVLSTPPIRAEPQGEHALEEIEQEKGFIKRLLDLFRR